MFVKPQSEMERTDAKPVTGTFVTHAHVLTTVVCMACRVCVSVVLPRRKTSGGV